MITTVDAVCDRVRRDATLSLRSPAYTLAAAVDENDTELPVTQTTRHQGVGSIVAVGLELMFVLDTTNSGILVKRGYLGTTPAAHAEGEIVEVDPRISKASMVDWIEAEVGAWGERLFAVDTVDLTAATRTRTYDLVGSARPLFLLEARLAPDDRSLSWRSWDLLSAKLLHDRATSEFPSGTAIQVQHWPARAATLRVAYAQRLDVTALTTSTDLATRGLTAPMIDALEKGLRVRMAEASLLSTIDQRATGASRTSEEVGPIDVVRAVEMLRSQRDRAIADAGNQLRTTWPIREG